MLATNPDYIPNLRDLLANSNTPWSAYGMDRRGNNEVGAWARRIAQLQGYNALQREAFLTELDPYRRASILSTIEANQPGAMWANADATMARLNAGAAEQGDAAANDLKAAGLGAGAQAGARLQARNKVNRLGNDYLTYLGSPEGTGAMNRNVMGALGYAQDTRTDPLLNTGHFIEGRSAANEAARRAGGLNSWVPQVAQFAGMFSGGMPNYLGAISGAGGGSTPQVAFGQQSYPDGGPRWWTGQQQ